MEEMLLMRYLSPEDMLMQERMLILIPAPLLILEVVSFRYMILGG